MNPLAFESEHPLLTDRDRLEKIANIMYVEIQRTLFPWKPALRLRIEAGQFISVGDREQVLAGSGISADDVLADAFLALLQHSPEHIRESWEGLAFRIAHNKAVDAIRASRKGLRGTKNRPELWLVSGDAERIGPDGESEPSIIEMLPSNWGDPEEEFFKTEGVVRLRDLAREILEDRDREIFFAIHFGDYSRKEIGDLLGLTSQRVGQIYKAALRRLYAHPDYPYRADSQLERTVSKRRN